MTSTIQHDGDTWRILSKGAAREGQTYCHLASTTRFNQQKNGQAPVQIGDWIDDSVISSAPAQSNTDNSPDWLRWHEMTKIVDVVSIATAMDLYYKPDRLNRPGGTRERLIKDREECFEANGWDTIASHHDSITGRAMYLRRENGQLVLYMGQ